MENKWIKQGGNYKIVPSSISVEDNIPAAIYTIDVNPMSGEFSLSYIADRFEFDFEILGLEGKFINHVLKSYENTSGNFGVLLNGVKGSGKTVTAKILANQLNLPVILVDTAYKGIDAFIASLNFECILFFDEFEKNFHPKSDINILTIMDGVYNCCARKVFILTTNELTINPCLLSRPSRIRYKKEFTNISLEVINHLMDKFLKDQSVREELFRYVTSLEVCSVDIIKAIITELNIHGKDEFSYIKEIFNVSMATIRYDCVMATSKYYDYDNELEITRNVDQALRDIMLRVSLADKPKLSEEEQQLLHNLSSKEIWGNSITLPCYFWNLKKGMYINGNIITEISVEQRLITAVDDSGKTLYIYIKPTHNYNVYTGGEII